MALISLPFRPPIHPAVRPPGSRSLAEIQRHLYVSMCVSVCVSVRSPFFVCYLCMFEHYAHTFALLMSFEPLHVILSQTSA